MKEIRSKGVRLKCAFCHALIGFILVDEGKLVDNEEVRQFLRVNCNEEIMCIECYDKCKAPGK